jgi:hypothetical protein
VLVSYYVHIVTVVVSLSLDMEEMDDFNNSLSGGALVPDAIDSVHHTEQAFVGSVQGEPVMLEEQLLSGSGDDVNNVEDEDEDIDDDLPPSQRRAAAAAAAAASAAQGSKWTTQEDNLLREIVEKHGPKSWKKVASLLGSTRTDVQCLHRWNKVLKPGLHKGTWTKEEDSIVLNMVMKHGVGKAKWSSIAAQLPGRIGKQCRERWFNHLDPSIKKGEWMVDEELIVYEAQRHFGNRWCEISKLLPGRTENAVKNRYWLCW